MGQYDFTYEVPENFYKRVIQFLNQSGRKSVADAFQRCKYDYIVIDYAHYEGMKGDVWNKKAVGFTIEGPGKDISVLRANPEAVKEIFEAAVNCLETIKIMYMDIPDDVTKTYFQMTPFLEKGPQLYKIALDHYQKYNSSSVIAGNYNNNGNAFALFSAMMNPGAAMGMGMPQAMPYGQPGMAQQVQPVPDVTMGVANGVNPFDAASPAMSNAQQVTDNKQFSL
jgi:hypothetical protein